MTTPDRENASDLEKAKEDGEDIKKFVSNLFHQTEWHVEQGIKQLLASERQRAREEALDQAAAKVNEIHAWDMWNDSLIKKNALEAAIHMILSLKTPKDGAKLQGDK